MGFRHSFGLEDAGCSPWLVVLTVARNGCCDAVERHGVGHGVEDEIHHKVSLGCILDTLDIGTGILFRREGTLRFA